MYTLLYSVLSSTKYPSLKNLENVNNQLKSINSQVEKDLPEKEKQYDALEVLFANASNHRPVLAETVGHLHYCGNKLTVPLSNSFFGIHNLKIYSILRSTVKSN